MLRRAIPLLLCVAAIPVMAQRKAILFTYSDTLRGSIGPERAWWDATVYDVRVRPDFASRSIEGVTIIGFMAVDQGQRMQIDLQQPLIVDSVVADVTRFRNNSMMIAAERITAKHENNVLWVDLPTPMKKGEANTITIHYHGVPRAAVNPPWDGGWIWKTDEQGNPWMSVACQGLGASVWYPCKDTQSDEPEDASLHIVVPDSLQAIGNGRLRDVIKNGDGTSTWNWHVSDPINSYNLVPYIGKYAHFSEVYQGVEGPLDCDYWMLASNEAKAREQFKQVPSMLKCFEDWFGPYPFYKDGYKLVEAPHLGMEHQSAVAYGNHYLNGYLGHDLSGSGWGLKWDYIIIHESGHEWFGNSITTADIADMWVQEGFTDYSETLYTQCLFGEEAGNDYVVGLRNKIMNDKPVIGPYGVNTEGSGDMYYKGANLIHMIRHMMHDDERFKAMMREMNKRFYHKVTTSAEVETFINSYSERDFSKVFDQYLRTTRIPVLEWGVKKKRLWVRWSNCVKGLEAPVRLWVNGGEHVVTVTDFWMPGPKARKGAKLEVDRNWYVNVERVNRSELPDQKTYSTSRAIELNF